MNKGPTQRFLTREGDGVVGDGVEGKGVGISALPAVDPAAWVRMLIMLQHTYICANRLSTRPISSCCPARIKQSMHSTRTHRGRRCSPHHHYRCTPRILESTPGRVRRTGRASLQPPRTSRILPEKFCVKRTHGLIIMGKITVLWVRAAFYALLLLGPHHGSDERGYFRSDLQQGLTLTHPHSFMYQTVYGGSSDLVPGFALMPAGKGSHPPPFGVLDPLCNYFWWRSRFNVMRSNISNLAASRPWPSWLQCYRSRSSYPWFDVESKLVLGVFAFVEQRPAGVPRNQQRHENTPVAIEPLGHKTRQIIKLKNAQPEAHVDTVC